MAYHPHCPESEPFGALSDRTVYERADSKR